MWINSSGTPDGTAHQNRCTTDEEGVHTRLAYLQEFQKADVRKQKENYDRRRQAHSLPPLPNDLPVWVDTPGEQEPGRIIGQANTPQSYTMWKYPLGKFVGRYRI